MKRAVWKYVISAGRASFPIPTGGVILFVGLDPLTENPAIWVEVDPSATKVGRHFAIYGTGHEITEGVYVGSTIQGPFAWHVYEGAGK